MRGTKCYDRKSPFLAGKKENEGGFCGGEFEYSLKGCLRFGWVEMRRCAAMYERSISTRVRRHKRHESSRK